MDTATQVTQVATKPEIDALKAKAEANRQQHAKVKAEADAFINAIAEIIAMGAQLGNLALDEVAKHFA